MIWELCLPRRVVEIDYPSFYITDRSQICQMVTDAIAIRNTQPPLISRVCCESREVALEHRGIYGLTCPRSSNRPDLPAGSEIKGSLDVSGKPPFGQAAFPSAWIQPAFDDIHLNQTRAYNIHRYSCEDKGRSTVFQWIADKIGSPTISMTADLLFPFSEDSIDGWPHTLGSAIYHLASYEEYALTLVKVRIHVPLEVGVRSGLFGLLGDDRVKLVDPADWAAIEQYKALWTDHGSSEDTETAAFFHHTISDRGAFQARLKKWKDDFVKECIWHWCMRSGIERSTELPDPGLSWLVSGDLPRLPRATADIKHRQLNDNLPWVQRQKKRVPAFHPKIMFKLCGMECFLPAHLRPRRPGPPSGRGGFALRGRGRGR